ncbi:MAG: SET domain-containing protein [Bacteroidota bacterium]
MPNHIPSLYVGPSTLGGRGVFTNEEIPAEAAIELAPVIVLSAEDRIAIHGTALHDYYFIWEKTKAAIALGYGGLYNHAAQPNADFYMDYEQRTINFFALRTIAAWEEITINYAEGGDVRTKLWFTPKKA